MGLEQLAASALLGVGLALIGRGASASARLALLLTWIAGTAGLTAAAAWRTPPDRVEPAARPVQAPGDGFVGSGACRGCHPANHATWHRSYHRTMTQVATPDSVAADFGQGEVEAKGQRYRLERRGDQLWAEIPAGQGSTWHRILQVTGSHHMQIFWYGTGAGRELAQLPLVWLIGERRFIPRNAAFLVPPFAKVTAETGRWNEVCIRCHATQGRPGLAPDRARGPETGVAELGIACEACHGPGQAHVRANGNPGRRYGLHLSEGGDPTIVNPARLPPERSAEVCGQCHGITEFFGQKDEERFRRAGFLYRPGATLRQSRFVVQVREEHRDAPVMRAIARHPTYLSERYWRDGQVRISGRDYNGLIDSPCYERGEGARKLHCLSCHDMHPDGATEATLRTWRDDQLRPGMDGDAACTSCHGSLPSDHAHHAPGSSGSRCQNCHMPYTTWGLMKAIRSHRIGSPSVAETLETGRPNACNACHLDRSLHWTGEHLARWYGIEAPPLRDAELRVAASVTALLSGDAGQRALAAWSYGWPPAQQASGTDWMAPYLAQLLSDPYDVVRFAAGRSLGTLPAYAGHGYDFVAPVPERLEAGRRAVARWRDTPRSGGSFDRDAVLLGPDGDVDFSRFDRLLQARDDRPMLLAE